MSSFQTESGRFWTPNLVLSNDAEMMDKIGTEWRHTRFCANGSAHYIPNENGAWKYMYIDSRIKSFTTPDYSSIHVFLLFKRKPRFAIVNVIVPTIFMSFLSIFVFLIPSNSGERISYTITLLLAIAVFLTLVGENLPKNSNPMAYISYYLIGMLTESIRVILATIFSLQLYYADDSESVPGCLTKLVTWCRKKKNPRHIDSFHWLPNTNINSVYIPNEETEIEGHGRINGQVSTIHHNLGKRKHITMAVYSKDVDNKDKDNEINITLKDASDVVDIAFFIFFLLYLL
ncbi:5-hydroxytryptamine receptor 3A-like [Mercenaria mercenaria]|uniref:5-hydroxytryptamine receptor 3A-like n=1 Tax=Mercenaria mercenaria TaxID=6596 RepID=UPI00234E8915|nr:5-hydroxytryptamine receptor 3A-like [Mercenaria mercenaria]